MQAFVGNRYKSSGLKCLNIVQKSIQAISLANITTVDSHRISHQAFKAQVGNGLRFDIGLVSL